MFGEGVVRNSIGLGAASYKSVVLPFVGAGADRDVFGGVLCVIRSASAKVNCGFIAREGGPLLRVGGALHCLQVRLTML